MKASILLYVVILMGLFSSCYETTSDTLCIASLKGKIVSTGPACAGVAIQILSEDFDPVRVDTLWFDQYTDNPTTYKNVFKTYPYCSVSTEQQDALLNAFEKGTEFLFIFDNPPSEILSDLADCTTCKPLVSLPENTNRILIVTEECNDQVIVDE